MTNVLITGATGFIGKHLIAYLQKQGCQIRVLVRKPQPDLFPTSIQQHIGDLCDPASLQGIGEGIETVFHLGGYAHAWKENQETALQHEKINLQGTRHLLDVCRQAGCQKFIFFSSIKAVGDAPACIDETWDKPPDTPYGMAKRVAEDMLLETGRQHQMHVVVLRLALVYGPSLKGNLYQMLKAIDKGYFLPIPPIQNRRSLVSVYDVCQAAWLAARHDEANGKIYYVTDNQPYSTFELYAHMREALGLTKPAWSIPLRVFKWLACIGDQAERLLRRRLPFNSQAFNKLFDSSEYSSQRIQQDIGFTPQYSLWELLPDIVQSYRKA